MRIAIVRSGAPADVEAARGRSQAAGARWVQFGHDLLVYGPNNGWRETADLLARGSAGFEELPGRPKMARLHLVMQKGRVFQRENPDVPVLLDRGRYLVVEMDPDTAGRMARDEPCYGIRPLGENEVVYRQADLSASRARTTRRPEVLRLLRGLDLLRYRADRQRLVEFETRNSAVHGFRDAADFAAQSLLAMGYAVVQEDVALPGGGATRNVIADRAGTGSGGQVLVFGHLDSLNADEADPEAAAPGADDNASGAAGVLAIARALRAQAVTHDLRFILFGGEEQGLIGSRQYVAQNAATLPGVRAALNMDMIGSLNGPVPTVLLEGGEVSRARIERMAELAAAYTNLEVQTSFNPFASDHVPFIEAGVPAVLTIEGADGANDRIHTAQDTLGHLNDGLAFDILRMNIAFLATELGLAEAPAPPDRPPAPQPQPEDSRRTFHFSGRYTLGEIEARTNRTQVVPDPLHRLETPVFLEDVALVHPGGGAGRNADVALRLHIDFDGPDPLDVVSGTIAVPGATMGDDGDRSLFIGRITGQTEGASGPVLVVEDFVTRWPKTGEAVDRLDLVLSGGPQQQPRAQATFTSVAGRAIGPFTTRQESQAFRTVEVEIDIEADARDPEPYDTHAHPDRPPGSVRENLTLEEVFARAGIEIRRSPHADQVDSDLAGDDARWTNRELHDAMEAHWSRFANQPQFSMWIFLARHHVDPSTGGIMFDANILDAGGVDRQGTAVFTETEHYHMPTGQYAADNPPAEEAARREMFFNLIHETGHAFNLYHSFQKGFDSPWEAPDWMPVVQDPRSLSWMNYPERATQIATGSNDFNATWFYNQFRFEFDTGEKLFLRHAPERLVLMGDADWGVGHGRIARAERSRILQFEARVRKPVFEFGEPVTIELKLANRGPQPILVPAHLDPCEGAIEIAITAPDGTRRPFVPFNHSRVHGALRTLAPNEAMYESLPLIVGKYGLPFKAPGAYRIEASFLGAPGAAAAVLQVFVAQVRSADDLPAISELFGARIARLLTMRGSREMGEELDRLDWVLGRLPPPHPLSLALRPARAGALAHPFKRITGQGDRVVLEDKDPDAVVVKLEPVVENLGAAADTIGHICLDDVVEDFVQSCVDLGKRSVAGKAMKRLLSLYRRRKVIQPAIDRTAKRVKELS